MCKSKVSSENLTFVINREKNNSGAEFTLRSVKSGKDFTYKVKRSSFNGRFYTHIFVETQYMEWKRLGHYFNGKIFNKRQVVDTPSANAIAFVLAKVETGKFAWLDEVMEVFHLGSCMVCGRTLTDATSIELGIGPVCRS